MKKESPVSDLSQKPQKTVEHIKKFTQGKQGVTGLLSIDNKPYVYKLSQYMNYLTHHEFSLMKGLESLNEFCPHFCKAHAHQVLRVNPDFIKEDVDPFSESYNSIYLDVLTMEYIEDSLSLCDLIENSDEPDYVILGIIKQTILAVMFAQKHNRFVHYDLHSMNILLRRCDKDEVHVYKLDDDNVFYVPTYGYIPIIIDYGFGRSDDLLNKPSYISLAYNDAGYMAPAYDHMADMKLFLVTISEDFREYRPDSPITPHIRNIVKNMFEQLDIDWRSGWDVQREQPLVDQLFDYIENIHERSDLFADHPHFCMDILQSLITLPLAPKTETNLKELKTYYRIFVKNFLKFEESIGNSFYALYFLKKFVDIVRKYKELYLNDETKEQALSGIRNEFYEEIQRTISFCNPKGVDYDMLVCSLLLFVEKFEAHIYWLLNNQMKRKYRDYNLLEIKNIEQIFGVIDLNLDTDYDFNENTLVHVFDMTTKSQKEFGLDKESVKHINQLESYLRGDALLRF